MVRTPLYLHGMSDPLSFAEARLLVLEISVAALIAQLPRPSLEEVVGMLTYVAGVSEEVEETVGGAGEAPLGHVRHWANEMLDRVMASRKLSRPGSPDATDLDGNG
jgi:hypothetical protein